MIPGGGPPDPGRAQGRPDRMVISLDQQLHSRRQLLRWGLGAGGLLLVDGWSGVAASAGSEPPRGFELLDVIPFADGGRNFVERLAGEGRDGRRALDLGRLTSKSLVTPIERFFVRTRHPSGLGSVAEWKIVIDGLVEQARALDVQELEAMAVPLGAQLLECAGSTRNSGFGLMSAAEWQGVPMTEILRSVAPRPEAGRVLVSGLDPEAGPFPGGNWIFSAEDLTAAGAALATRMNGVPLPDLHGGPLRLIVPGWYGCCWVKWVTRIAWLPDAAAATSQMREFAGRTHQQGTPRLAREYAPATIDPAALPVRVEMWRQESGLFYRVVGVAWGGRPPTPRPAVRLTPGGPFVPVENYAPAASATWSLWSHVWHPERTGRHAIELRFADPTLQTRRMDSGHYLRSVVIPEI